MSLTDEMKQAIDKEIAKFPTDKKASAVLSAIRVAQDLGNHSIDEAQLNAIAAYLDMPRIAVYEVATFYTMCKREPVGKHHIGVCTNLPCMLNGAEEMACHVKKRLGIDWDQVTADGQFSLEEVECMGACANAPMFQVNKDYHENLTTEKVDKILEDLKQGKTS